MLSKCTRSGCRLYHFKDDSWLLAQAVLWILCNLPPLQESQLLLITEGPVRSSKKDWCSNVMGGGGTWSNGDTGWTLMACSRPLDRGSTNSSLAEGILFIKVFHSNGRNTPTTTDKQLPGQYVAQFFWNGNLPNSNGLRYWHRTPSQLCRPR